MRLIPSAALPVRIVFSKLIRSTAFLAYLFIAVFGIAQAGEKAKTNSLGAKFRLIEGGRFIQGTSGGERRLQLAFPLSTTGQFLGNAEEPAHVTWITKPFYLAETEVTVGQFRAFVEATGFVTSAEQGDAQMVGWEPTPEDKPLYQSHDFLRDKKFNWKNPGFPQDDNHPVVGISWADAKAFCKWLSKTEGLNYRLPTEAEWELSCRAGSSTWFSFGDSAQGVVHKFGNLGNVELERHRKHAAERQWLLNWDISPDDGHVFTAPVGFYEANPWGIKDMHGNVWEWCEDLWLDTLYKDHQRPAHNRPTGIAVDPVNTDRPQTPANDLHSIRGGSWCNGDLICRSANRAYWDREDAACYIGFRLARDVNSNTPSKAKKAYDLEIAAVQAIEAAGGSLYSSRGIDIAVRFEGEVQNEAALNSLKLLPDLTSLHIGWRQREAVLSQAALKTISGLSNLEILEFSNGLNPDKVDLSVLTNLRGLKSLHFPRAAPLRDIHFDQLKAFDSLVSFRCYGTSGGLTDAGISKLRDNRNLKQLNVWENQATGRFLRDFAECPLTEISSTRLYNGEATLEDEHAAALIQFPGLRTLRLTGQNRLSDATMKLLGQLSNIRDLDLSGCQGINGESFAAIGQLSNLRSLNLSDTNAGDVAAAAIATVPRLQELRIGCEGLSDLGMRELENAFSIERLTVESNSITDSGLKSIGRINRLRYLTIVSDSITGNGLGPITRLPELQEVSLVTTSLEDVAFDYLSQAKSILKLRLAHRGHRPPAALTNAGMMKMSDATWLKELWLPRNDTGITEDKIDELKKLMPKTSVIPYTVSWK